MVILVDFGLAVLIWIVQLVIYPSFRYFETEGFAEKHKLYVQRISIIVAPLMFAQVISRFIFWDSLTPWSYISIGLIIAAWYITFAKAVPLHRVLTVEGKDQLAINRLVRINRYRTAIWTAIFAMQVFI